MRPNPRKYLNWIDAQTYLFTEKKWKQTPIFKMWIIFFRFHSNNTRITYRWEILEFSFSISQIKTKYQTGVKSYSHRIHNHFDNLFYVRVKSVCQMCDCWFFNCLSSGQWRGNQWNLPLLGQLSGVIRASVGILNNDVHDYDEQMYFRLQIRSLRKILKNKAAKD